MRKNLAFVLALIMALSVFSFAAGAEGLYTPGTYEASAQGMGGPVKVVMTFSEDAILSVEAVGEGETKGLGDVAIEKLKEAVMEKQSAEVDSVAGATVSNVIGGLASFITMLLTVLPELKAMEQENAADIA